MGLLYALFVLIRAGDLTGMPAERLWSAIIWVLFGLVLLAFAKRLGEWLGRGLE
jgi:hypothetical protein